MPSKSRKADEDYFSDVKRRFLFDDAVVRDKLGRKSGNNPSSGAAKELFKSDQVTTENMSDIIDKTHTILAEEAMHDLVGKMLPSNVFRGLVLLLIVTNAIIIVIQTDEQLGKDYAYLFSLLDQFVLTIFAAEIALKWYYGFRIFWKVGWNILDFIIVASLLLGPAFQYLGSSRTLRILKVLRAARSLRSISGLQGLSLVVQTVLQSLPDMFNIALVLCIIMTVFAVAGITLFGKDIPEYFGNLGVAVFSLFICITQDGWLSILDAFKKAGQDQPWIHTVGVIYLVLAITIGAFVFANLAVAAVVTNLEIAMKEIKSENRMADSLHYVDDEEVTHIPIISVEEATKNCDFSAQAPIHTPDLKNLNPRKLENYFMMLIALEENLAEYRAIRSDLDNIFDATCELNVQEKTTDETNEKTTESEILKGTGLKGVGSSQMKAGTKLSPDSLVFSGDQLSSIITLDENSRV